MMWCPMKPPPWTVVRAWGHNNGELDFGMDQTPTPINSTTPNGFSTRFMPVAAGLFLLQCNDRKGGRRHSSLYVSILTFLEVWERSEM